MKKLIIVTCILLLTGCKLLKKVDKTDRQIDSTEKIIERTSRSGDTVTYTVPQIRYRDTTIYTVNRVGTRIETRYDDRGEIDLINCISSEIEMFREELRSMRFDEKVKQKEEKAEPDKWFWIWTMIVAYVIFIVSRKINLL